MKKTAPKEPAKATPAPPPKASPKAPPNAPSAPRGPAFPFAPLGIAALAGGLVGGAVGYGLALYTPAPSFVPATPHTLQVASQIAGLDQRLEALAARMDAQSHPPPDPALVARLEAVEDALEGLALQSAQRAKDLPADWAADWAADQAGAIGQIRAEIAALRAQGAALSERMAQELAAAPSVWRSPAFERLASRVAQGVPFEALLQELSQELSLPPEAIPPALAAAAPSGIATLASLEESFPDAARKALVALRRADPGEGLEERLGSFFKGVTQARRLTPDTGEAPESILARAEAALKAGALEGALQELRTLPEPGQPALQAWRARAEARLEALESLAGLEGALAEAGAGSADEGAMRR